MTAESMNGTEDAQEDFLREIQGLVAIAEEVDRELNNHPLMLGHQLGAGLFVARSAALYERRLAPTDVRPADNARLFHRQVPKRRHVSGNSLHYIPVRLRVGRKVPAATKFGYTEPMQRNSAPLRKALKIGVLTVIAYAVAASLGFNC